MKNVLRIGVSGGIAIGACAAVVLAMPPASAKVESALACQARVVAKVGAAAKGQILLTFDRVPDVNGASVSGRATDRTIDRADRAVNYSCDGANASYTYADGGAPKAAKAGAAYGSGAVRACQSAVKASFSAASLSASDTKAEFVLGISGSQTRRCEMDGQRVVSSK